MEEFDIAIENGTIVDDGKTCKGTLLIKGEKIASIVDPNATFTAKRTIDATGKYVMPGIIDAHNHPVYADRIDTISKASLAGGVTTTIPYIGAVAAWGGPAGLREAIENFINESNSDSVIDFGVHCTITQNSLEEAKQCIPDLVRMGVVSFKGFTAYRKRGMLLEDEQIITLMCTVRDAGGLMAFHAESGALVDHLEACAMAEGKNSPVDYPPTHPDVTEAEAVFRVMAMARETKTPLYLPHLTNAKSLEVVSMFKKWGMTEVYTETCPHYLTLTDEELGKRGNLAKMSPPLRKSSDIEVLWKALADGDIDVLASDAAGHDIAENEPLFGETFTRPHGTPGVDTVFTVPWDEGVNHRGMDVATLVKSMTEAPAKIFGMYPEKGSLHAGTDADVLIFDPESLYTVPGKLPYMHVDYSLFENRTVKGAPDEVFVRGTSVFKDGEFSVQPGFGKFVEGKR